MALGKELNFDLMANLLANRWMLAWYIIGTVAAIFHFANGLWSFLVSWGITQSRRSQQISTYVMIVVFVLLSVVGVRALLAFA
jgi:succinate dehydrogenase / fumarate reductase cytochrome b subunit